MEIIKKKKRSTQYLQINISVVRPAENSSGI
jgi:hypothetical protein